MEQLGITTDRFPCLSKSCKGNLSVVKVADEIIAPAIIQLFLKGFKPIDWNSGLSGKPCLYVAFDFDDGRLRRNPKLLPQGFQFTDSYLDFENKREKLGNGDSEIIHAEIPPYQSEAERLMHVIRLNRLFLNWVGEALTYDDLADYYPYLPLNKHGIKGHVGECD
jgi:hypothetical protein